MNGGTYYVTAGVLEPWVLVASLPYSILVTTVLMGKHVDKFDADSAKGIHTLPVLLGEQSARFVTQALIVGFFGLVTTLVLTGTLPVWTLLSFLALKRTGQVLSTMNGPHTRKTPSSPRPRCFSNRGGAT